MSTFHVLPRMALHLLRAGMLALLIAGCASPRLMYAGPIKLRSDAPSGVMLEGPNKRPIECYPEPGDLLSDLKEGQWVVVEGSKSHDGDLAIGLRECRVLATATDESASGPGLELRRRPPPTRGPNREEPASTGK
ncbi:MAG TPA: hypothetical protein VK420_17880 [Longimicrobium sp.]|nr:hypothetical protein [Longimicrobium sp.]